MRRIDLPDGQWADVRDPDEITVRGRRPILAVTLALRDVLPAIAAAQAAGQPIETLGLTEEQYDTVLRLGEVSIVAVLAAWSLPDPLPTVDTVGDLPATLYDALSQATAPTGAVIAEQGLVLDTSVGDGSPDPKGRTGGSKASGGHSKAGKVPR